MRDKCNKLKKTQLALKKENTTLKLSLYDANIQSCEDYKTFKELDLRLRKKDEALAIAKLNFDRLMQSSKESRKMLRDTLNVKLRYEAIIKKLIENEAKGA